MSVNKKNYNLNANNPECIICRNTNNTKLDPIMKVECCPNAKFHQSCVTEYIKTKNTCPCCTKKWEIDKYDKVVTKCMNIDDNINICRDIGRDIGRGICQIFKNICYQNNT